MLENGELGEQVEFYQDGSFTALIDSIIPIGKVEFRYFERGNKNTKI